MLVGDLNTNNLRHLMEYYARKFTMAEMRLKDALPEWINEAGSPKLKVILSAYQDMVNKQVKQLELFFSEENIQMSETPNQSMLAFVQETKEKLSKCRNTAEKDALLLETARTINRFKINMYDMAAGFAHSLGLEHASHTFEEAEQNEKLISDNLNDPDIQ